MKAGLMTRLAVVEAALHPDEQWWKTGGLCSLLQCAARYGVQPAPEVDEHSTGLGRLLWEARQQVQEERTC
jgi:hypothetical protein